MGMVAVIILLAPKAGPPAALITLGTSSGEGQDPIF